MEITIPKFVIECFRLVGIAISSGIAIGIGTYFALKTYTIIKKWTGKE